jgi:GR25 family glycosyltransferase involved in LPS biosynthesis/glycosyltransferase involved in cell wall biosynthesis
MIVRDEAHIVGEVIDSVAPHIDCWVVVDTGSTDQTIETICWRMAARGVPGDIHERPWRDFGSNRTEALDLCRGKADYIWVIDADDIVVGSLDLTGLRADSYLLRYGDEFRYWRRQIFRDGLRWRYEGVIHECPVCLDQATEERLDGEYYIDSRRLGGRSRDAETYRRDALLLRDALERNPDDARSVFYLAQSHFDAGDYAQALDWYTRRAGMGGWGEEVFYSRLRRAACLTQLGESWDRALGAYLEAWEARPTRAEPLYEIARHYRLADSFELGYLFAKRASGIPYPRDDSLFIAADVYGWRAVDELAICAFYTGRYEESFDLSAALLEDRALPEFERARIEENRDFCVPRVIEQRCSYPVELIERINERIASDSAADREVTLTITSCRRRVLAERTINSFLRCCTDVSRIGRWIWIDNGSAELDRARIRELYPFFEFIYTDPADERHADSMNRLLGAVTSPFWLHLEDDWEFFWRGPYIERSVGILSDDATIAQVAFNRNYGETLECRRITGGEVRRTRADGVRYRLHEQIDPDTPAWERHFEGLAAGQLTVAYWPHFTLRPALMRTEAIRPLGRFGTGGGHFELEFARRYAAAGLKTAFLDAINCLHSGRLTSQAPGEGRVSAYELVGDGEHPAHPRQIAAPSMIDEQLRISVVNLDRRPDRWRSFQAGVSAAAGQGFADRCRRFAAIDGIALADTAEIRRLFRGNDFGFRRGIVGCALSHISIWRSLAQRAEDDLELVFEDDARPFDRFDRRLTALLHELRDTHADFDIAFLGYFPHQVDSATPTPKTTSLRPMRWDRYFGGCWAYVVSARGARKLVALVERDGVQNGIDIFLRVKGAELRVLECDPPLVDAPLALLESGVDSDVQYDFESVAAGPSVPVIRVRMLANWCSSRELCEHFDRMTTDEHQGWRFRDLDGIERDLKITWDDDEEPDHWVVINAPRAADEARFDPRRTVVFQMEPLMWSETMRERWGSWAAPSPLSFLQVRDHRRYRNSSDWLVGQSYSELLHDAPPHKDRTMAACVSAKYFDPGHVRRIDFLRFLDDKDVDLDIYGSPDNGFRRWRSTTPPRDKRIALLPYRYYFDAENNSAPNFYTEKIVDCLLAETLCFYWGCPNLDSFFDPRAFIRLELEDFEADLVRVRAAIEADEWSKRLPYIRAEKQRILEEYQFFPTLARVIDPARRARRWHIGAADRSLVDLHIGKRRCGVFVELSDRRGAPEISETVDVERRLDWSGLCLEADASRARRARGTRDCTMADDAGGEPVEQIIARNGLSPIAIDWLNLAVERPFDLIRDGGRLDLSRVRANLISMPIASEAERRLAAERLASCGYHAPPGSPGEAAPTAMLRAGCADVFGFYHVCTINTWREVMEEQLERWASSGLAEATTRIFATVVGPHAEEAVATLTATCGERLEIVHRSEDISCFERPILEYMRRFCEHREPLARACWYMHAKGVSRERFQNANITDWRRLMEHFVVERWQDCLAALDAHDACGINWRSQPAPHFSGNFWWARPRYLASLPLHIGPMRFDPERWLATNQPYVSCLYESGVDHYLEPYPPTRYLGGRS